MNERKLTLEIIVNQDAKDDWAWLYDSHLKGSTNGINVRAISSGWMSDETADLLMMAGNAIRALKKGSAFDPFGDDDE